MANIISIGGLSVAGGRYDVTSTLVDDKQEVSIIDTPRYGIQPSGTLTVTEKGVYDVYQNEYVDVQVSGEAYAYICATYIEGHACTCSGNGKVLTAPTATGYWVFGVDGPGEYVLTDVDLDVSVTVNITARYQVIPAVIILQWIIDCRNNPIGSNVTIDNNDWIIVNKTSTAATLALKYCDSTKTTFGSNSTYKDSILANLANTFESFSLSNITKLFVNSITISDVTAKVWVPTYAQVNGSLSHYSTKSNRICTDISGTSREWWTSGSTGSNVYTVSTDGTIRSSSLPNANNYFRPHIEVNIDF